jgi:Fe-S cluster biogenesis protein NfuA
MTDQEHFERLEKEIEVLKKRVDYFYNEIKPYLMRDSCKHKHFVMTKSGGAEICYIGQSCSNCPFAQFSEIPTS